MIDRRKNLCYIITVSYLIKTGTNILKTRHKQFISMHSINTKQCENFAKKVAKRDKQFEMFPEDWLSQYTVPNSDYCK